MAELLYTVLLAVGAFWLGACPFSLWVGRWFLGKEIREYGDGNPGAANVFRAGGRKSFLLASILDVAKGTPFIVLAHSVFRLTEVTLVIVALSAILGNAFSPILRLKGGKSIAITGGTLLALPQHDVLIAFIVFMLLGFLLMENDAWIVILAPAGSLAYLLATGGTSYQALFMLLVLVILAAKHFDELKTGPRLGSKLVYWLRSRKRES